MDFYENCVPYGIIHENRTINSIPYTHRKASNIFNVPPGILKQTLPHTAQHNQIMRCQMYVDASQSPLMHKSVVNSIQKCIDVVCIRFLLFALRLWLFRLDSGGAISLSSRSMCISEVNKCLLS